MSKQSGTLQVREGGTTVCHHFSLAGDKLKISPERNGSDPGIIMGQDARLQFTLHIFIETASSCA